MLAYSGTIVPTANFNGERGAIKLQKAMKGLGSDEKVIIEVLTSHGNAQRQEIKKKYKALYGRELSEDIKGELGGHFENLCLAMLAPHHDFLVECLRMALAGDGRDLVEILVPLQSNEKTTIANVYQEKFGTEMETKEELGPLLKMLLYDNGKAEQDVLKAQTDAQQLKQIVNDGNADAFVAALLQLRLEELRASVDAYDTIEEDAKTLLTSEAQLPYLTLIKLIRSESEYFAERVNSCLQGLDSDDVAIIRIFATHSETNLGEIKERYKNQFGRELSEAVMDDTSGDYRKLLLKILG